MTVQGISKSFTLDDGRTITIETGKLAKQADGAVVVRMGNTMLLATVVSKKEAAPHTDFMPLSVDYQEKYAGTGRFPGGFFKREARPSEYEILISRLVDRALRPLFPDNYHAETQVLITMISGETDVLPDALACLAASSALMVSDIPFHGPISEVRVGRVAGKLTINPTITELQSADIDIMVAANMKDIMMVEGELKEVSENDLVEAMKFAHEAIKIECQAQLDLMEMVEKSKVKREYNHEENDAELEAAIKTFAFQKVYDMASKGIANKHQRKAELDAIAEEFLATMTEEDKAAKMPMFKRYFHAIEKEAIRNCMLDTRKRLDGRVLDEIRPIWCEVDYLPTAHGSAIFTRGETQSLTTVTLGSKLNEQIVDGATIEGKTNFMLHYNFPPFSTGEVKQMRGLGRREVGHGNLALRALKFVLPGGEINPYTVRVVSDILESNGSSSMATVCAGTLALMDAGVKIPKPVSGIAMGLITDDSGRYVVLSDILGDEDHLGDMDFKVCGTRDGITACQMDIKIEGLKYEILAEALEQARRGRLYIMDKITEVMPAPREDYKPHVPRIVKMTIPKEFIGAVIGPGGKIIQEMQNDTKSTIVIQEMGEFGIIDIVSNNLDSIEEVKRRIKMIVAQPEIGEIYKGVVKNIQAFGAFVEILPGKDGLLHISEIDWKRIKEVEEVLHVGDTVEVKLIEVDKKTGKMKLSRKALLEKPANE
ncbi:MAG: polyribonucleotide nucleotidyltransferase [Bacteroidota bacterium]